MNKKFFMLLMLSAVSLAAKEWKDISYYEKDAPAQGDMAYRAERCKLDLKTPDKFTKFPTLVWLHGGGMKKGKKSNLPIINSNMIGVVTVNYRLSSDRAKCPDYIYDAAAAVAWVIKNIENYGGDPKQVYVAGMSAGGYLTAIISLDKRYLETFGVSPKQLAGVFPISGQMTTHFQILNERRAKDPSTPDFLIDEFAPIFHASSKDVPPMTMLAGDSELDWPARVEENKMLEMRMRRVYKNPNVKFYSIPGTTHGTCSRPSLAIINDILSKLSKQVSQPK
ncbi:MAG: carboxylesterase family protein [Lentisphaeria bacterium]|nr:carboxylesterase family protein [Lentisphaeria bacterium]